MSNFKEIKLGAFWVLIFVGLGGPLSLLRNWLISNYDATGKMIGDFALIMIIFNIINTFFTFGGSTLLTNYIPKLKENQEVNFFKTYLLINSVLFIIFGITILIFPNLISFITHGKINENHVFYLLLLALPITFYNTILYFLQGKRAYKISSLLGQFPNIFFLIFIVIIYILKNNKLFLIIPEYYFYYFVVILLLAIISGIVLALKKLNINGYNNIFNFFLPKNFWTFSVNIHFLTIITFAFQNIDQIFILKILGINKLGFYFILIQVIEMIRFIPNKIGQVLLASFSKIINDDTENLVPTYKKVSYFIIILNLIVASTILIFSNQIFNLYNINKSYYLLSFILLIFSASISNLGNVNSMLILAKEKSSMFLLNNCIVICAQLLLTYLLRDYDLLGIVLARLFAIAIGQFGLYFIIYKYITIDLLKNSQNIKSQIIIIALSLIIYKFQNMTILQSVLFFFFTLLSIFVVFKINLINLIKHYKST